MFIQCIYLLYVLQWYISLRIQVESVGHLLNSQSYNGLVKVGTIQDLIISSMETTVVRCCFSLMFGRETRTHSCNLASCVVSYLNHSLTTSGQCRTNPHSFRARVADIIYHDRLFCTEYSLFPHCIFAQDVDAWIWDLKKG